MNTMYKISKIFQKYFIFLYFAKVLIVTPQKFGDKTNVQFINMLLEKYNFNSVTLINQALLVLYAYTSNTGIVVDLGEKIDILPICNGIKTKIFDNKT